MFNLSRGEFDEHSGPIWKTETERARALSSLLRFGGDGHDAYGLLRLKDLDLTSNAFQGEIPTNLSYCSEIQVIRLAYNNLVGKIPEELSSLSTNKLKRFQVSVNGLTGSIPRCNLQALNIAANRFQGELPASIANFSTALQQLIIGESPISGSIPEGITRLIGLTRLVITISTITGEIPERIGTLERLEDLRMYEVGGEDDDNKVREGKIKDCLDAVLKIGVSCSMEAPGERMDMRDVVAELCRIRTKTFRH
ncbi:hypothetical protein RHSIM_Rhsim13G0070600 [Rhododendron simsii]|uniref:Uncharacterized protein n=1 Tax=Rhododendron simsii TaxID=118357 RepID=A0A834L7M1_RHOSS|nr:hypothetical protein RHSIM_Rhsim13G0070600 [Rhododendron simsii]